MYLACVDVERELTPDQRLIRAHDLSIAALLGETIYNFGELLQHPIMDSLTGTPQEWLKNLLNVFNEGNIGKFESIMPLFPQEVCLDRVKPLKLIHTIHYDAANSRRKSPILTPKNLSHGFNRVRV